MYDSRETVSQYHEYTDPLTGNNIKNKYSENFDKDIEKPLN